ncbi:MAG TPA: phasin family protein [Stellaceae bacterium]|nr:phasin family protein [Stellaceae bacterium]
MAVKPKKAETVPATLPGPISSEFATPQAWGPLFSAMNLESFADLGRENIAAVTKANVLWSEGVQAIGQEILTYAKSSLKSASHTATALLGAKTLDEVIQLNSDLAKETLETMVERSAKLSEMGVSLASEAMAPIGGRVEATFAKLGRPLAA